MDKKRRLGRGLDSLLAADFQQAMDSRTIRSIALNELHPASHQPRSNIVEDDGLHDLSKSIKSQGVIQPIVVQEMSTGGYEVIAGERRWRASELAGLKNIPAIIYSCSRQEAAAISLVENIQREGLNSMEEAVAIKRLQDDFSLSQEEMGRMIGRSRSSVANIMRLNNLPYALQCMLRNGDIEMGHARSLLSVSSQEKQKEMADLVVDRKLSVRQLEYMVAAFKSKKNKKLAKSVVSELDIKQLNSAIRKIEDRSDVVSVRIGTLKGKPSLAILVENKGALERILSQLSVTDKR